MKAIILNHKNGERHLAMVVGADFDTQAWVESRRAALVTLRVTRVTEHYLED